MKPTCTECFFYGNGFCHAKPPELILEANEFADGSKNTWISSNRPPVGGADTACMFFRFETQPNMGLEDWDFDR